MTEPARWPEWRITGYPPPNTAVLITLRDLSDRPYVDLAIRRDSGSWVYADGGELDEGDILAWMPLPPPDRNRLRHQ